MFSATVTKEGNASILYLHGKLNIAAAADFSQTLSGLTSAAAGVIILECSNLEHLTTDGIKPFIAWMHANSSPGNAHKLRMCNPKPFVRSVLEHTGVSAHCRIYSTLAAALAG